MTQPSDESREQALANIEGGCSFPFDRPDRWRVDDPDEPVPLAVDWAHKAARGILYDLSDRRGIRQELEQISQDDRVQIVSAMAEIIRAAKDEAGS
jgi:hypothetical protein